MEFQTVKEFTDYLYTLPKLHDKSDLSYIKRILKELGNPQDKVKTVHVTGTNGKGSTSYYLSNLLEKAGQQTGLFVSPYILKFNERIQLNGQNISDKDLLLVANQVQKKIEAVQQTDEKFGLVTFEYEVAIAFTFFEKKKCDYAVIEVGIGAEHDKTNVITPCVSIITTIGMDHEKIIGPTLKDIAIEKSGIIKKEKPVVLGNIPDEVKNVILKKAKFEHAPMYWLNEDFEITSSKNNFLVKANNKKYNFKLRSKVEIYDIAVALQSFLLLNIPLAPEKITDAIDRTIIPGRYQVLKKDPLIIADGAHNVQAMSNLLSFVHSQQKERGGKLRILLAMMKDKDIEEVFGLFSPKDEVLLTTISYPRAAKYKDFPENIRKKYSYQEKFSQGLDIIEKQSASEDIILITGSFYLVSAVLNSFKGNSL